MNEDKAHLLRKTFIIITLILIFATAGLLSITSQLKTVTINYFGEVKYIRTLASNVNSFLLQNKINVGDNTIVTPSNNAKITNGMEIKICSEEKLAKLDMTEMKSQLIPVVAKVEEVIETIPYTEEKVDNASINRGTTKVVTEGIEGQKSTKYLVKYTNNEEIYRAQLSETILSGATNKVIEVGTKLNVNASRSSTANSIKAVITDGNFKQYSVKLPVEQQQFAYNLCQKYGIDYELFLAVIYKESGFNPNAIGGGNSYGLCQIHISNHASLRSKLGISNFFDPYDNMTAGAYLLSQYFGSARKQVSGDTVTVYALNSYNMGEGVYYRTCFSQGVVDRAYSTSIISFRNKLINQGWL